MIDDAHVLLDSLLAQPWGQVSGSVYETGRLVALSPWLVGHRERVAFLADTQQEDGRWGASDPGYALVPTLSAVDALLKTGGHVAACERGLSWLRRMLNELPKTPDLPAFELLASALLESINQTSRAALPVPADLRPDQLHELRAALISGARLPPKLMHAAEALLPARYPGDAIPAHGGLGASPAATAAWLGDDPGPDHPSRRYLEQTTTLLGGPVPCALPITVFERSWVLSTLARAGIPLRPHPTLLSSLTDLMSTDGTPAAAGLPADADSTAVVLHALMLCGHAADPRVLSGYETDTHFATWPGEQGQSPSTNAHVLDAFGLHARTTGDTSGRSAIRKTSSWLRSVQYHEGYWTDRWHASPYYATATATLALNAYDGPDVRDCIGRALAWVLNTQHRDGSWGQDGGSAEETAYAVQILLTTGAPAAEPARRAAWRAVHHLADAPDNPPALWHDKDLYRPAAIVRSAVLAARFLIDRHLGSPTSHPAAN
ncbi:hypothetical protein [Embleya sp. NPDC001921]